MEALGGDRREVFASGHPTYFVLLTNQNVISERKPVEGLATRSLALEIANTLAMTVHSIYG